PAHVRLRLPTPLPTLRSSDLLNPRTDQSVRAVDQQRPRPPRSRPGQVPIAQGYSLNGSRFSSPLDHLMTERMLFSSSPVATHSRDRKSTRLNSSHQIISYAVF